MPSSASATRRVSRFTFEPGVSIAEVEETLLLAIISLGCLYGDAAARMDVSYAIDAESARVVLDTSTRLGRRLALLFVGLCGHLFGEDSFRITRTAQPTRHPGSRKAASTPVHEHQVGST